MAKKRIPIASVKVGMYLCGIDRSWLDTPFLRHRFLIGSPADLAKIQQCGIQEITIDTERGLDAIVGIESQQGQETASTLENKPTTTASSASQDAQRIQQLPNTVQGISLMGELDSVTQFRERMLEHVQEIFSSFNQYGTLNVDQIKEVVQSIVCETLEHEEAYLALIRTRDFSPALHEHVLNVSALATLLGRAAGVEETALINLGTAGLLHDIGLLSTPQLFNRPLNQLSELEQELYQTHPKRGLDMLAKESHFAPEVLSLIESHHVKPDGSGYPSHIPPTHLDLSSHILQIVDEYEDFLAGQQTGESLSVRSALQALYMKARQEFTDNTLVRTFISLIGIYPIYSLVELSTGERAIVTGRSHQPHHPTLLLIQDANHQTLAEPIPFNFSGISEKGPCPEITKILQPEQVGIQLDAALADWVTL